MHKDTAFPEFKAFRCWYMHSLFVWGQELVCLRFGLLSGLEELANADDEVDDHKDDPLSKLDLEEYIVQQLHVIYKADAAGFQNLCSSLTQEQVSTLKHVFAQT